MLNNFCKFITEGVTAFNAVSTISKKLRSAGYTELHESGDFRIEKGGKYFVTRNSSSIIAFNVGRRLENPGIMGTASHTDCPSFKIKPGSIFSSNAGVKLNVEKYGSPLFNPWFDRPLGIAGRIIVKDGNRIISRIYKSRFPFCLIPSVAIHMNREANDGQKMNLQIDLQPLVSLDEKYDFKAFLAQELDVEKENVCSYDLYLFPMEKPVVWGGHREFISAHHLDDLECAYTCLEGFINRFHDDNINLYASFDNEEVGSLTRQGAAGDFFISVMTRLCEALNLDYHRLIMNSMMLSCDNAHALHPNHPEKSDPSNRPVMNKGLVIKYNANQSYTSDSLGFSILTEVLSNRKIPFQTFANRSDMPSGSTLGNLLNEHVSCLAVDVGLAQLAMHSPYETAGSMDVEYMIDAIKAFYDRHLVLCRDGEYLLQ